MTQAQYRKAIRDRTPIGYTCTGDCSVLVDELDAVGPQPPGAVAVAMDVEVGDGELQVLDGDDGFPAIPRDEPADSPVGMPFRVPVQVSDNFDVPRISSFVATLPNVLPEEGSIPLENEENQPPTTFKLLKEGSKMRKDIVIASNGFTYSHVSIL